MNVYVYLIIASSAPDGVIQNSVESVWLSEDEATLEVEKLNKKELEHRPIYCRWDSREYEIEKHLVGTEYVRTDKLYD